MSNLGRRVAVVTLLAAIAASADGEAIVQHLRIAGTNRRDE